MITFDTALAQVLKSEGGYVNDPNDPGGETNLGISRHSYPDVDIANLTPALVAPIYKRDYWDKIGGDLLPSPLNYVAFDCAVNQGVSVAMRLLQDTIVPTRYIQLRLARYRALPGWGRYGAGWASRLIDVLCFAMESYSCH